MAATGGLWVRGGGVELHLGVEEGFRPALKAHPGILVSDIDALALCLGADRAGIAWEKRSPGYRRFYVRDNSGNGLEFLMSAEGRR